MGYKKKELKQLKGEKMTNGEWLDKMLETLEEPIRTFALINVYEDFTDSHRYIFVKYYGTVKERYLDWRKEERKE